MDDMTVVQRDAACPGVPHTTSTASEVPSTTSNIRPRRPAPFAVAGARLGTHGVVLLLMGGMLLFGVVWLKVLVPYTPIAPIPCPFETLTGYDCPGCGLQSSLTNLFELRWKYVFMANLLSPILLPLFFVAMISGLADTLFGVTVWRFDLPRWAVVAGVVIVIVYGIARNIPTLGIW
ncbi:MAG: DUF2752 domain-containing protein [Bacteroidetes bacterium]|nr:DUF2752 domain-containing protein [Bacteroidota bacterium]